MKCPKCGNENAFKVARLRCDLWGCCGFVVHGSWHKEKEDFHAVDGSEIGGIKTKIKDLKTRLNTAREQIYKELLESDHPLIHRRVYRYDDRIGIYDPASDTVTTVKEDDIDGLSYIQSVDDKLKDEVRRHVKEFEYHVRMGSRISMSDRIGSLYTCIAELCENFHLAKTYNGQYVWKDYEPHYLNTLFYRHALDWDVWKNPEYYLIFKYLHYKIEYLLNKGGIREKV